MIEKLERVTFAEHLNSRFRVTDGADVTFDLELIEVTELNSNSVQEVFALLFRGPVDAPRAQNSFTLQHKTIGTFVIFLTPVKADDDGLYFEAIFNRLVNN
jgi:hypothetical protein